MNSNFWVLFRKGFPSSNNKAIFQFKYTILVYFLTMVIGLVGTYCFNTIIQYKQKILSVQFIVLVVLSSSYQYIKTLIEFFLNSQLFAERMAHTHKIVHYLKTQFANANWAWKEEYGEVERKEAYNNIWNTYHYVSWIIIMEINNMATGLYTIVQLSFVYPEIIVFVVAYYILMLKLIIPYLNKLSEDKNYDTRVKQSKTNCDNQFALHFDLQTNPLYQHIYPRNNNNFMDKLTELYHLFEQNSNKRALNIAIRDIMSNIFLLAICGYSYQYQQYDFVVLVLVNLKALTSGVDVYLNLYNMAEMQGSRISQVFTMLDKIGPHAPGIVDGKYQIPKTITINSIEISAGTRQLKFNGLIKLNFQDPRKFVVLQGPKGCGKSVTARLLAGEYDNHISKGFHIDNQLAQMEFRDIQRIYIKQTIGDRYSDNSKKTITMGLSDLFPGGTISEIKGFLDHFEMVHKMPIDLTSPISKNSNGLSGGEKQAFCTASNLWNAIRLNNKTQLLIVDEIDTAIDVATACKIALFMESRWKGLIVFITHHKDVKACLANKVQQIWEYKGDNRSLSFSVITDPIQINKYWG